MENPLSTFLSDLFLTGKVTVERKVQDFLPEDLAKSAAILDAFYEQDRLHMPHQAPPYAQSAAIWAAQYLYRTTQLLLLRDQDNQAVMQLLPLFPDRIAPNTIYSIDLCFRYLPDVFVFAKGLAPNDILVKRILETAINWPFSSVGMKLPRAVDPGIILDHPSLRYAYIDRIIEKKDMSRVGPASIFALVREALGEYATEFWPAIHEKSKTLDPSASSE